MYTKFQFQNKLNSILDEFFHFIFMVQDDISLENIGDEFLKLNVEICKKHPHAHLSFNKHLQKWFRSKSFFKDFHCWGNNVLILENKYGVYF